MNFAPPTNHELMIVVVYESPSDFPGQYVARPQYLNCTTRELKKSRRRIVTDTYGPIKREMEDMMLVRVNRMAEDDPVIKEYWL